jgi:hypothetical protein
VEAYFVTIMEINNQGDCQPRQLEQCIESTERDAARYRWIKAQANLTLSTEGILWYRENGERYYPSHRLAVNSTGFHGIEHLDDLIDQAMEVYPVDHLKLASS